MQRKANEISSMVGQRHVSGVVSYYHPSDSRAGRRNRDSSASRVTKRTYTDASSIFMSIVNDRGDDGPVRFPASYSKREFGYRSGDPAENRQASNGIVLESMKQSRKRVKNRLDDPIGKRGSVPALRVTHHRSMDPGVVGEAEFQDDPRAWQLDETSLTILGGPRESNFLKSPARDRSTEDALVVAPIDQPRLSEPSSVSHVAGLTRSRRDDRDEGAKQADLDAGNVFIGMPINHAYERTSDYYSAGQSAGGNEAESSRARERDIGFTAKRRDDLDAGNRRDRGIVGLQTATPQRQTRLSGIGNTYALDNRSDGTRVSESTTDYPNFDFGDNKSANSRANDDVGNVGVIVFSASSAVADYIEDRVAVDGVSEIGNRIETNSEYVQNNTAGEDGGMEIRGADCRGGACSATGDNDKRQAIKKKELDGAADSSDNREHVDEDHLARVQGDISTTPGNDSDADADADADVDAPFTGFEGSQKIPVKINHGKSPPMVPQVERFDWRHFGPHKKNVPEELPGSAVPGQPDTVPPDRPKSPSRDPLHRARKTNAATSDVTEMNRRDGRGEETPENDENLDESRLPGASSGRPGSPGLSGAKLEPDENFAVTVNTMVITDSDVEGTTSYDGDDSDGNAEIDVTVPSVRSMEKTNITILGLFEMTYGSVPRPEGSSELEAAKLAVDRVNELDILKRFRLRLIYNDTKVSWPISKANVRAIRVECDSVSRGVKRSHYKIMLIE